VATAGARMKAGSAEPLHERGLDEKWAAEKLRGEPVFSVSHAEDAVGVEGFVLGRGGKNRVDRSGRDRVAGRNGRWRPERRRGE